MLWVGALVDLAGGGGGLNCIDIGLGLLCGMITSFFSGIDDESSAAVPFDFVLDADVMRLPVD